MQILQRDFKYSVIMTLINMMIQPLCELTKKKGYMQYKRNQGSKCRENYIPQMDRRENNCNKVETTPQLTQPEYCVESKHFKDNFQLSVGQFDQLVQLLKPCQSTRG